MLSFLRLFCTVYLVCSLRVYGQSVVYVTEYGSGNFSGSSWANASTSFTLRTRLATAPAGTQFWIAKGTYKTSVNNNNNRADSFVIPSGVQVYGGFKGFENGLQERELTAPSSTTFSGEIGFSNTSDDNALHVVTFTNASADTRLDGIVVTGGYGYEGAGIFNNGSGAGNQSNPVIANCYIVNNTASYGGGLNNYGYQGSCSPTVINCVFSRNGAWVNGGGVYNNGYQGNCQPRFINCLSSGNTARDGGAYYNEAFGGICRPAFINCTLVNNHVTTPAVSGNYNSGALYNDVPGNQGTCEPLLLNCIIWANTAESAPSVLSGIYNNGQVSLTITYSTIQGGYAGAGNSDQNPQLTSTYMPSAGSPVINAGDPASTTATVAQQDAAAKPRILNGQIDQGAYEYQYRYPAGTRLYVTVSGAGTFSGADWNNALSATEFPEALLVADAGVSFWVAQGVYLPTQSTSRHRSFVINSGVDVIGGFAGQETDISQRIISRYPTIFSGDIGQIGSTADNSYQVVRFGPASAATKLDGVTIRDGYESRDYGALQTPKGGAGVYFDGSGSGNRCEPQLINCIITANRSTKAGGGLYLDAESGGYCRPTLESTTISQNIASDYGGGIYIHSNNGIGSIALLRCLLTDNAVFGYGGGFYVQAVNSAASRILLQANQCIFRRNRSSYVGGLMRISTTTGGKYESFFTNCLLDDNTAGEQGGLFSVQASFYSEVSPVFTNCTFVNNKAVSNNGNTFYTDMEASCAVNYRVQNSILLQPGLANTTGPDRGTPAYQITYSIFEGGYSGAGNVDTDPKFINAAAGNYQLQTGSPAMNTGDPSSTTGTVSARDLAGNLRIVGLRIDMGAYESPLFITARHGAWNEPDTWVGGQIPEPGAMALIRHTVYIPSGYKALAQKVTCEEGAKLILSEAGQLRLAPRQDGSQ